MDINWTAISVLLGSFAGISALVFTVARARLSGVFITRDEHGALAARVEGIEQRLQDVPSQDDMKVVRDRVSDLSREVGALGARIDGVRDTGKRTEHMVEMLLMRQLERESGQ